MERIYSDYRAGKYLQHRQNWEPWFSSREANAFQIEEDLAGVNSRVTFMKEVVRSAEIKLGELKSCLDFGGDLGQFIPAEIVGKKYILDPSSRSHKMQGIEHVKSLSEVANPLDFIMNCHTLEHIPNFTGVIEDIYKALKPGGYLYLEVPQDSFKVSGWQKSATYMRYLDKLSNFKMLFILVDFLSGVTRQFLRRIPFFGIIKQSEHINYFSEASLVKLLEIGGFTILPGIKSDLKSSQGRLKLGRLGLMAQKVSK
jgi:SAM-dependent methyltransferase